MGKKNVNDGLRRACKLFDSMLAFLIAILLWILISGCATCPCTRPTLSKNPNINAYLCWYYPDWYIEWKIPDLECDEWNTPKGVQDSE